MQVSKKYDHSLVTTSMWTCHALAVHGAVADEADSEDGSTSGGDGVQRTAGGTYNVDFVVNHFSSEPPPELLDELGVKCTVELLAKPLPHR